MITEVEYSAKHRGELKNELPSMSHCCFAGCDLHTCRRCHQQVCVRQGLHDCRPPYVGRHRQ